MLIFVHGSYTQMKPLSDELPFGGYIGVEANPDVAVKTSCNNLEQGLLLHRDNDIVLYSENLRSFPPLVRGCSMVEYEIHASVGAPLAKQGLKIREMNSSFRPTRDIPATIAMFISYWPNWRISFTLVAGRRRGSYLQCKF